MRGDSTRACTSHTGEMPTNARGYADHISEGWWVVSWNGNAAHGSIAWGRLGRPDGQPAGLVCDAVADREGDKAAVHSHGHHLHQRDQQILSCSELRSGRMQLWPLSGGRLRALHD